MLRLRSLGSGSSGNATVIEARCGLQVTRLLVDCGLGLRELEARLQQAGLTAADLHGIFITHEHADHIGCAAGFARRQRLPIWMSRGTHAALPTADYGEGLRFACDGEAIALGALQFTPFTVPHDAREPLQLTCSDGATRLGVLTDLGHASAHVMAHLAGCHTVLLECNHDPELLQASRYPAFLKRRVGGRLGHLANHAAAAIAQALVPSGLRQLLAAHLSQQNTRPALAQAALATALGCAPGDVPVADPLQGSAWLQA